MSNWTHIGSFNNEQVFVDFTRPLKGTFAEIKAEAKVAVNGICGRLPQSIEEAEFIGNIAAHHPDNTGVLYLWTTQVNGRYTHMKNVFNVARRQKILSDSTDAICTSYPVVSL
jgi:hypothetical protein